MLAKIVDLAREEAQLRGFTEHPYDALLGKHEPGMTTREFGRLAQELEGHLLRLLAIAQSSQRPVDDSFLRQDFPIAEQMAFCQELAVGLGLPPKHARFDTAVHPFCVGIASPFDVRMTVRYAVNNLLVAIASFLHELGHLKYELGLPAKFAGTPLARYCSVGVHESQARKFEVAIGRSLAFWTFWYPKLQGRFPRQLGAVPLETFYRAINKVEPSLIRVEADPLTYNLHIIPRFEAEAGLGDGSLPVRELRDFWNARYAALLGICPYDDAVGVLQDPHLAMGLLGYFPTYMLGNVMSLQFWKRANTEQPDIETQIAGGNYSLIGDWLGLNIHSHGRRFTAPELVHRITGGDIDVVPLVQYLEGTVRYVYC